MGYTDMATWYSTINILRYHYHMDDFTLLNFLPFERDITLSYIKNAEDKKKQKQGIM